jgi:hypothetical protein
MRAVLLARRLRGARGIGAVAVAAVDRPPTLRDAASNELVLVPRARALTAAKIRAICRIAHAHEHDALVRSMLVTPPLPSSSASTCALKAVVADHNRDECVSISTD